MIIFNICYEIQDPKILQLFITQQFDNPFIVREQFCILPGTLRTVLNDYRN